jgi:hypothetical protein
MTDVYIDEATAKFLYDKQYGWEYTDTYVLNPYSTNRAVYPKITQALAMKWLRDIKGIIIEVNVNYDMTADMMDASDVGQAKEIEGSVTRFCGYGYTIHRKSPHSILHESDKDFTTYEEAVEAALKYTLINLV